MSKLSRARIGYPTIALLAALTITGSVSTVALADGEVSTSTVTLDLTALRELESRLWQVIAGDSSVEDERSYLDSIDWKTVAQNPRSELKLVAMTVAAKDTILRKQIGDAIAESGNDPKEFWFASNWGISSIAAILWGTPEQKEAAITNGQETVYGRKFKSAFLDSYPVFLKASSSGDQNGKLLEEYRATVGPLREVLDLAVLDITAAYLLGS